MNARPTTAALVCLHSLNLSAFGKLLTPLIALISLLLPANPANAQGRGSEFPTATATQRTTEIRIDGRLDEQEWAAATRISGFTAGEPVEGVPPEHQTEVFLLYDESAIYIGARMYDSEPNTIYQQLTRRDELENADYFEVSLDSNLDRRTAYTFRISAAGVQEDLLRFDDTRSDRGWDAVWQSAASIDGEGWTAELRIPLSQLRYTPGAGAQSWGANFSRYRNRNAERSYWALESRIQHGGVSVFGELAGILLPRSTRAVEIRPYALARRHTAPASPGDPFNTGREHASEIGTDLRYGLGATFVLDLAINPDFGQAEVDPTVINLTAYETFFPERRPFFSRDDRLFDFGLSGGSNKLFYSRRIGRAPQGGPPANADFVDMPGETTILGAAKITGRTASGMTLGVLTAVTDAEHGRAHFSEDSETIRFASEPASVYGVLRAQQDMREGASHVGGIFSALHRYLPSDRSLDWLTSNAFNVGVDFEHNWLNRTWALWGFFAGSLIEGSPRSITRYQRSPNHYFQRPDAHYLHLDSTATSMAGAEWRLQFERRSGRHWTGAIWAAQRTAGFEVDDIGYGRASERLDGGARIAYQQITPGRFLRDYRFSASTFHNWRHEALDRPFSWTQWWDRAHKSGRFGLNGNATLLNYWGFDSGLGYSPEFLSDSATRGGPLMLSPASWNWDFGLNSDRRRPLSFSSTISLSGDSEGGTGMSVRGRFNWRPTSATEIGFEPEYSVERDLAQYVATTNDSDYLPTFGPRYLFAELDRRTLALPLRLNLVFSPTLTLQFFAQPLLSSGDYLRYKQLLEAEGFDFDHFEEGRAVEAEGAIRCMDGRTCTHEGRRHLDFHGDGTPLYSFADRDFNIRSLRGNAVLRWEYRPGSTLYAVWQQSRLDEENLGRFHLRSDIGALVDVQPQNTFILKFNYWIGF